MILSISRYAHPTIFSIQFPVENYVERNEIRDHFIHAYEQFQSRGVYRFPLVTIFFCNFLSPPICNLNIHSLFAKLTRAYNINFYQTLSLRNHNGMILARPRTYNGWKDWLIQICPDLRPSREISDPRYSD